MTSPSGSRSLLLDACVVINLYATGHFVDILDDPAYDFLVADRVHAESMYVRRGGEGDDALEREAVELAPVVVAGLLHVVRPDDVELATFIDISLDLEDGEALTIALAVHRGWLVATDDRKAQRIAHERGVLLLTTLDLVKAWSERKCISPGDLHAALMALRERARYAPGRTHALYAWWEAAISLAE